MELLLPDPAEFDADRTQVLPWDRARGTLVNFGAVGQPRDGDPRAAYGIVDTDAPRPKPSTTTTAATTTTATTQSTTSMPTTKETR